MSHTISPGVGCRPDGSKYPFVVTFSGSKGHGIMGGYETRVQAQGVQALYQSTPRKGENAFTFTVEERG